MELVQSSRAPSLPKLPAPSCVRQSIARIAVERGHSGNQERVMAKRKKESTPRSGARARARGRSSRSRLTPAAVARGLAAADVALALEHEDIAPVVALVRNAGGAPLGAYREPLGGKPL